MNVLFSSEQYLVQRNAVAPGTLAVITFGALGSENVQPDDPFFGEEFFNKNQVHAIGVRALKNDWYLGRDIDDALLAVRNATKGMRLVGYGASMGGYAAINFADDLNLATILAFAPQFSIHPLKTPFEDRFVVDWDGIDLTNDRLPSAARGCKALIVYDPNSIDAQHEKLIRATHPHFETLKICFSDHHPLGILRETGLLRDLVLDVVHDRFNRPTLVRSLRQKRRGSFWLWLQLSQTLEHRGNIVAALKAIQESKRIAGYPTTDVDAAFALDRQHGSVLSRSNRFDDALDLLSKYDDHSLYGAGAQYFRDVWKCREVIDR